jgi:hypothetical protein
MNSRVSFREQAITPGWPPDIRREQLRWFAEVYDQLFPSLRLFLYDARIVFSAPLTIFGPRLAVIYVGRHYVAFRDRERVQANSRHFDWLVREATVSDRDFRGARPRGDWIDFKIARKLFEKDRNLCRDGGAEVGVALWRPVHAVHGRNGHAPPASKKPHPWRAAASAIRIERFSCFLSAPSKMFFRTPASRTGAGAITRMATRA